MFESSKVVAAVCHGVFALPQCRRPDGSPLVSGRQVTGFSNSEEETVGLKEIVPFLIETRLQEQGGVYSQAEDWNSHVVVDGKLITGQNPQSSEEVADAVAKVVLESDVNTWA